MRPIVFRPAPRVRLYLVPAALLLVLAVRPVHALEEGLSGATVDLADTVRSYEEAIALAESSQGAYGADIAEPLLGLGLALQSEGRHGEAIDHFKRGVHLMRINDGLYSPGQIPLVQGEIASLIARADYLQADERQRYLYRVQLHNRDSGEPLAAAFMQHANWQLEAYRLGIGGEDYLRLMDTWDLYRRALEDVRTREGEASPNLMPPLQGMLSTQYLIASYIPQPQPEAFGEDLRMRHDLYRFTAYQHDSYQKGTSILAAMHGVQLEQPADRQRSVGAARILAALGDWHLWHGERTDALRAYAGAIAELGALEDAQTEVDALFGAPVAIPDLDGLRPLPPEAPSGPDSVQLQFSVTDSGRVVDVERLDDNDALDGRAYQLMRKLRKTRFRPRFEAGQPAGTEQIVKSFDLQ